jgi:hypothetical protein
MGADSSLKYLMAGTPLPEMTSPVNCPMIKDLLTPIISKNSPWPNPSAPPCEITGESYRENPAANGYSAAW